MISVEEELQVTKIVASVGFRFPGGIVESIPTNSDRSLLDADIVIFRGDISEFPSEQTHLGHPRTYQGDRWLSEDGSFALKRAVRHWNSQLKLAHEANKTIIALLPPYERVYVDTGERKHSGTGRNRQTTVMLAEMNNYEFLPVRLKVIASVGKGMKAEQNLSFLIPLWKLLKDHLQYQVMLEGSELKPLLLTRTGNKTVGGVVRGKGVMVLWPDLTYGEEFFYRKRCLV
jgi:hypothetical protein